MKVLDFGIAKSLEGSGGPAGDPTVSGFILGTAAYLAPEQAQKQKLAGQVSEPV